MIMATFMADLLVREWMRGLERFGRRRARPSPSRLRLSVTGALSRKRLFGAAAAPAGCELSLSVAPTATLAKDASGDKTPAPPPGPRRPGATLLRRPGRPSDPGPLLGLFRHPGPTHPGQALPGAVVARNRRASAVVPVQPRRLAVRPRHPGGHVLPAALPPLRPGRAMGRRRPELAGRGPRHRRGLVHVRLRPQPQPRRGG